MRFLLCSLVSSSFLVLLWYSSFFLSSSLVWLCLHQKFPGICKFPFFSVFWYFLDLVVLFLPSFVVFCFSLFVWHIFQCQIPSLYLDCKTSMPVLGFPILYHFLESLMSSVYIMYIIAILEVCITPYISKLYDWVASSLLQIVKAIAHLL